MSSEIKAIFFNPVSMKKKNLLAVPLLVRRSALSSEKEL
jgi:hypothetical protein